MIQSSMGGSDDPSDKSCEADAGRTRDARAAVGVDRSDRYDRRLARTDGMDAAQKIGCLRLRIQSRSARAGIQHAYQQYEGGRVIAEPADKDIMGPDFEERIGPAGQDIHLSNRARI